MSKKEQILNAAVAQFYEHGLSVPAAKIAKAAGVSNGTLFNYFETKQQLVDAVYFTLGETVAAALKNAGDYSCVKEGLRTVWLGYTEWAYANPQGFEVAGLIWCTNALSPQMREQTDNLFEFIRSAIEQGIESGELVSISPDYLCELGCSQVRAAIQYTRRIEVSEAKAQVLVAEAFDIHWRGISTA